MSTIHTLLEDSKKFYDKTKSQREATNFSKHPPVDRELILKKFDESADDELISQKDLCIILKRCSWYITRLKRETDCAHDHQYGRYIFYKKSKVRAILEYVEHKKKQKGK